MGPVTHTYSTQTDTAERITKGAEKRSGSLLREGQGVYERSSQPEQQNGDRGRSTGNNARAAGTAEFEREGDLLSLSCTSRSGGAGAERRTLEVFLCACPCATRFGKGHTTSAKAKSKKKKKRFFVFCFCHGAPPRDVGAPPASPSCRRPALVV
jgi:hypothetical protein